MAHTTISRPLTASPSITGVLQAKQCHPQFDQIIEPVTDPIATPAAQLVLAERHPELPQITQLVDQHRGRLLSARERPSNLPMRQAEIRRGRHEKNVISYSYNCKGKLRPSENIF
jgi:hypothetical protein